MRFVHVAAIWQLPVRHVDSAKTRVDGATSAYVITRVRRRVAAAKIRRCKALGQDLEIRLGVADLMNFEVREIRETEDERVALRHTIHNGAGGDIP